jgi:hypothetical protein
MDGDHKTATADGSHLDTVNSSSGGGEGNGNRNGFARKFWRRHGDKQRLGSQDITMRERSAGNDDADADADADGSVAEGGTHEYRTYKRRWFGLVQLTLMNIIVSWDVSQPSQTLLAPIRQVYP